MKKDFILGEVANDFRYRFMTGLSKKAKDNNWKSLNVQVWTNEYQNGFYFTQEIKFNTGRMCLAVYRDVCDVVKALNKDLFDFEWKTHKTGKYGKDSSLEFGYEIHVENIVYKRKDGKNV